MPPLPTGCLHTLFAETGNPPGSFGLVWTHSNHIQFQDKRSICTAFSRYAQSDAAALRCRDCSVITLSFYLYAWQFTRSVFGRETVADRSLLAYGALPHLPRCLAAALRFLGVHIKTPLSKRGVHLDCPSNTHQSMLKTNISMISLPEMELNIGVKATRCSFDQLWYLN